MENSAAELFFHSSVPVNELTSHSITGQMPDLELFLQYIMQILSTKQYEAPYQSRILEHRSAQIPPKNRAFLVFPGLKSSLKRCWQLPVYMHTVYFFTHKSQSSDPLFFVGTIMRPWGCVYNIILRTTASFWLKLRTWSPRNVRVRLGESCSPFVRGNIL